MWFVIAVIDNVFKVSKGEFSVTHFCLSSCIPSGIS